MRTVVNVKSGFRGMALALAVVLAGAAAPTAAEAASKGAKRQAEISKETASLRDQISEASAEEADLADRLDAAKARRAALDAEVAALNAQVESVEAELKVASQRLDEMSAELVRAQAKLESARAQLAEAKDELRSRAIAAYVGQPDPRNTTIEIRTDREAAAFESFVGKIVSKQQEAVELFKQMKAEALELERSIELQRDQARLQRDVVANRLADVEGVKAQYESKRREVLTQEGEQARLLDEVRDRKSDFAAQLAQLQAESESIGAFLRGAQTGQSIVVAGTGQLSYPIPNARISSTFGPRVHPIYGDVRLHTGIDFAAGTGVPIRAAGDGVVLSAGIRGGYGYTILLDHGGALATLYAHQSAFAVAEGARVAKGQVIGYVGSTGNSTGPHLHFETRVNGTPVNPMQFL